MVKFFKRLFERTNKLKTRIRELEAELSRVEKEKHDVAYFLANRHYLESIDLKDLDRIFDGMKEQEKKDYIARASEIWANPVFLQELRRIIGSQSVFVSSQCFNWEQVLVGRGTINGVGLVEDCFRRLHSMHLDNLKNSIMVDGDETTPIV